MASDASGEGLALGLAAQGKAEAVSQMTSAEQSQIPMMSGDEKHDLALFPQGICACVPRPPTVAFFNSALGWP